MFISFTFDIISILFHLELTILNWNEKHFMITRIDVFLEYIVDTNPRLGPISCQYHRFRTGSLFVYKSFIEATMTHSEFDNKHET